MHQDFTDYFENPEFHRKGPLKFLTPLEERESYNSGDLLYLHLIDEKTGVEYSFDAKIRWTQAFPLIDKLSIHCIRPHPGIDWCTDRVQVLHYGMPEKDYAYIMPDPGGVF